MENYINVCKYEFLSFKISMHISAQIYIQDLFIFLPFLSTFLELSQIQATNYIVFTLGCIGICLIFVLALVSYSIL